ncbi:hypothetical protein BC831DRAFT_267670 [Entophlyctis helioformis]|nr:hypothetical protein BC831DRAFT_267670 [Entophlyctis helioformis]
MWTPRSTGANPYNAQESQSSRLLVTETVLSTATAGQPQPSSSMTGDLLIPTSFDYDDTIAAQLEVLVRNPTQRVQPDHKPPQDYYHSEKARLERAARHSSRSIVQHATTCILSLSLQIATIVVFWEFNQRAFGNNIGSATIFVAQSALFMLLQIHLVIMVVDGLRTMNAFEISGMPTVRAFFVFFVVTEFLSVDFFNTCSDSWMRLTDASDAATITTNLYTAYDFYLCPSPSSIVVTGATVQTPSRQDPTAVVNAPLLAGIQQSRASIADAQYLIQARANTQRSESERKCHWSVLEHWSDDQDPEISVLASVP